MHHRQELCEYYNTIVSHWKYWHCILLHPLSSCWWWWFQKNVFDLQSPSWNFFIIFLWASMTTLGGFKLNGWWAIIESKSLSIEVEILEGTRKCSRAYGMHMARLFMDSRMIYNNNKYADKWRPFIRDLLIFLLMPRTRNKAWCRQALLIW